jgi:hypothetical protein
MWVRNRWPSSVGLKALFVFGMNAQFQGPPDPSQNTILRQRSAQLYVQPSACKDTSKAKKKQELDLERGA